MGNRGRDRYAAKPCRMGGELNLPSGALEDWNDIDIVAEVESRVGARTFLLHDGRRPVLPSMFRRGKEIQNFLYLYVGSFVGGGLVLSNQPQTGAMGPRQRSARCR